jgi:hypothetical protein
VHLSRAILSFLVTSCVFFFCIAGRGCSDLELCSVPVAAARGLGNGICVCKIDREFLIRDASSERRIYLQ